MGANIHGGGTGRLTMSKQPMIPMIPKFAASVYNIIIPRALFTYSPLSKYLIALRSRPRLLVKAAKDRQRRRTCRRARKIEKSTNHGAPRRSVVARKDRRERVQRKSARLTLVALAKRCVPFQSDAATLGVPTWDLSGGLTNRGQQRSSLAARVLNAPLGSPEADTRVLLGRKKRKGSEKEREGRGTRR